MTDLFSQSSRQVWKNEHQNKFSLSICICLQRMSRSSTGSSPSVQWVFSVLTQNTSTKSWEEILFFGEHISHENWIMSKILISHTPNQKKKEITFVHYWPGQDLDQKYQGRSTSLKDSLFPFSLVHSWLKTRRKQPTVGLGSWAKSIRVNENISYWCHRLQNVLPVSHYDICMGHAILVIIPCSFIFCRWNKTNVEKQFFVVHLCSV